MTGDLSHHGIVLKNTSFTFTSLTMINDTVTNGGRDDHGEHIKGENITFFEKQSVMDFSNITRYGRLDKKIRRRCDIVLNL
jgi:hypothetical protein